MQRARQVAKFAVALDPNLARRPAGPADGGLGMAGSSASVDSSWQAWCPSGRLDALVAGLIPLIWQAHVRAAGAQV